MQTTLSPNLVVYASMTNQSPENNLTLIFKVTLTRTGILDCRGKPLMQKLEQNLSCKKNCSDTSDRQKHSKIYNKIQTITFICTMSRLQEFCQSIHSVVQSQPGRAATSAGREKTNPFA